MALANSTMTGAFDSYTLEGKPLERGKTYIVGRTSNCDILLSDPLVSKNHLQIRVDEYGNRFLTDLNFLNGTFVNGKRIAPNC